MMVIAINFMLSLFIFLTFILGLIIGSFLNVVILRYHTGRGVSGRSACFSCSKILAWFELVPVLSFLFLGGKCRHCRSRISWQYPAVELLTGLSFALIAQRFFFAPGIMFYYWVIAGLLIVITVYDLKHKIIPDAFVYPFIFLAVLSPLISAQFPLSITLGLILVGKSLLAGAIIGLFFAALWYFSAGRWMGFGDAKLGFGLGALLGFSEGINAVAVAFWAGAIIGLLLILISRLQKKLKLSKRFSLKSELPFAPFLILGIILISLFHLTIFRF